jgi:hypothetical protein
MSGSPPENVTPLPRSQQSSLAIQTLNQFIDCALDSGQTVATLSANQLRYSGLAFRVVTPLAAQGTAFQKHRRSNAGTVLNGKFLDVEY